MKKTEEIFYFGGIKVRMESEWGLHPTLNKEVKLDTKVVMVDQLAFYIAGEDIEKFKEDLKNINDKYRI